MEKLVHKRYIVSTQKNYPPTTPVSETDPFNFAAFASRLQTKKFGRPLRAYDVVSSTNDLAREWAGKGATSGSLVFAEQQTAGRGRLKRHWRSASGKNLTFSIIIEHDIPLERLGLAVIGAAVAIGNTLESTYGLMPQIKWPNDVLIDGRKVSGILFESEHTRSLTTDTRRIIAGIGLNVNQTSFEGDFRTAPTSIANALGRSVSREQLLGDLLLSLESELGDMDRLKDEELHLKYQQHLKGIGGPVCFKLHDGADRIDGIAAGIDRHGALEIMTADGMKTFAAGEVGEAG